MYLFISVFKNVHKYLYMYSYYIYINIFIKIDTYKCIHIYKYM